MVHEAAEEASSELNPGAELGKVWALAGVSMVLGLAGLNPTAAEVRQVPAAS